MLRSYDFPPVTRHVPLWLLLAALLPTLQACGAAVPEVQRLPRYEALLQRPLAERVQPADEAVLARAHRTNLSYGDDVRPRAADPRHPLAAEVRATLAGLPAPVARLTERYLAAVYLVEGDVGTATTEGVQDAQRLWSHAYVVLNLTALERSANAWAAWKEGSAFRPAADYALRMTVEPPATDDRAGAVRFILLHELGHVLGLALGVHGYWDDPDPLPRGAADLSAFAALSWELQPAQGGQPARLRSRAAARLPALGKVAFYRFDKAPLALDEAPAVYEALEQTDLPSLYATQGVYDDWAEAFAIYVHTALLHKPYRVEVLREGRSVQTYVSCIARGTCPAKLAQVRALLERVPAGAGKGLMSLDNAVGTH